MAGILAGSVLIALPMFGDYYTPDLVSASTKTNMIGNQIDQFTRQGSEKVTGAVLTLLLALVLLVLMFYYLRSTRRAGDERRKHDRVAPQPVGQAARSRARHGALHPVVDPARRRAILFAFNNGRSRTTWQGFSFRWFTGATGSVFHDPALQGALKHTLFLGVLCVARRDAARCRRSRSACSAGAAGAPARSTP